MISDGLISYKISQGNVRAAGKPGWSFLRDKGYDGNRLAFGPKLGLLYNGLGQLSDGVTGNLADWNDTGNPDWIKWIGWKDSLTPDPTITFHFSALRRFSSVRFHILNLPGRHEKMLFSKVILSFSKDGEYFAWKTIYEPSITKRTSMCNRAFWIEVNLEGHVGKDVTCDFQYYGWWVLISEVEFESGNFLFPSKSVYIWRHGYKTVRRRPCCLNLSSQFCGTSTPFLCTRFLLFRVSLTRRKPSTGASITKWRSVKSRFLCMQNFKYPPNPI